MSAKTPILTANSFALRLAAFYAAFFVGVGIQLPFLPVWLEAKGLDARAIGTVLAAATAARVIAIPLATRAADRTDSVRAAILLTSVAATFGFALMGLMEGAVMILAAAAVASAFVGPALPLADAYALRGLKRRTQAYGAVRLWGSAAFVVGTFAAGALLDLVPARDLIWLIVAGYGVSAMIAFGLAPVAAEHQPAPARASARVLLRSPGFLAVLAAASLIQASHALYYAFATIDWRTAGLDGTTIAALWALGVVAEIVLFAVSARVPLARNHGTLLMVGAAGAVVRWSAMALGPPFWALPPLQCLHALSFGATHLGAMAFIARAAPPGLGATAQGTLAVVQGSTMAAAMWLSGALYGAFGGTAYAAMAASAATGGLIALAVSRRGLRWSMIDSD